MEGFISGILKQLSSRFEFELVNGYEHVHYVIGGSRFTTISSTYLTLNLKILIVMFNQCLTMICNV